MDGISTVTWGLDIVLVPALSRSCVWWGSSHPSAGGHEHQDPFIQDRRTNFKKFHDSKIKFPLPHRVSRRLHHPRFTTNRPHTSFAFRTVTWGLDIVLWPALSRSCVWWGSSHPSAGGHEHQDPFIQDRRTNFKKFHVFVRCVVDCITIDSKIKFPLPHRVSRRLHHPRFTTNRPHTSF
ncbi:hypothetical protein NP493_26g07070 [Ridgeia piscesae]|uniref:Uncharacterized protein n=1 Tax=Ridgeia piscesae TaxID=27915 RepID=A0AAD9PD34_RIDPI|nr:hypothetical protein NP493_26g07070 [Ridgeia piscesae]